MTKRPFLVARMILKLRLTILIIVNYCLVSVISMQPSILSSLKLSSRIVLELPGPHSDSICWSTVRSDSSTQYHPTLSSIVQSYGTWAFIPRILLLSHKWQYSYKVYLYFVPCEFQSWFIKWKNKEQRRRGRERPQNIALEGYSCKG